MIPILVRLHLYIEAAPRLPHTIINLCPCFINPMATVHCTQVLLLTRKIRICHQMEYLSSHVLLSLVICSTKVYLKGIAGNIIFMFCFPPCYSRLLFHHYHHCWHTALMPYIPCFILGKHSARCRSLTLVVNMHILHNYIWAKLKLFMYGTWIFISHA